LSTIILERTVYASGVVFKNLFAINCFSNQQDTMFIMPNGINTQQRRGGGSFNKIEKIGRY